MHLQNSLLKHRHSSGYTTSCQGKYETATFSTGPSWQMIYLLFLVIADASSGELVPFSGNYKASRIPPEERSSYVFGYGVKTEPGTSSFRKESGDAYGRVVGSYGLTEADGRQRIVDYVADGQGFRARVRTNEPGTDAEAPAGAIFLRKSPRLTQHQPVQYNGEPEPALNPIAQQNPDYDFDGHTLTIRHPPPTGTAHYAGHGERYPVPFLQERRQEELYSLLENLADPDAFSNLLENMRRRIQGGVWSTGGTIEHWAPGTRQTYDDNYNHDEGNPNFQSGGGYTYGVSARYSKSPYPLYDKVMSALPISDY